ncbi:MULTISPECIES: energy transducer TonB [Sphingobacterium]|uniref:TonB family protein n=1 Tax=Sphingobacterium tenebrionis TaxID=3111775 RepID=A0ABU8I204_9SPHI|nr:energy transducer TonB [Sphingobacterium sp. CZ-2]QBR13660.1 energy transducer TonB [Sphingobacterium sp. CZ-2]
MIGSKLDLFKKEWLDVVFENRNKEYGAYALRKFAPKATNIALFSVSAVVLFFVAVKAFDLNIFPEKEVVQEVDLGPVTLEDLVPPPEPEEEEPLPQEETPPQRIQQDPPAEDLIRFPEPKVVDSRQVKEEVVTQEEIKEKNATPARLTLKGTPGGTAVPPGEFGSKKVDGAITGSLKGSPDGDPNKVYDFESVEVPAEYPGGINAFRSFVQNALVYPPAAIEAGVKGTVQLSFVIDRNGKVTDIKIDKDLSHGIGQAAVAALKKSKSWNPAIQNGRKVPVKFSLPIRLDLSQQ